MPQHILGFRVAQGLSLQSRQIVSLASVLRFNACHVSLAHNLLAVCHQVWIDAPTLCDREIALPLGSQRPQGGKGCRTVVSQYPAENPARKVVYGGPEPTFVFLSRQRFRVHRVRQLLELCVERRPLGGVAQLA